MNGSSTPSRAGVPVRTGRALWGHAGERAVRAVPVRRRRNGRGKVPADTAGRSGSPGWSGSLDRSASPGRSTSRGPTGSFVRRLGGGLRRTIRAAAWLVPMLFAGPPGLLVWAPAHAADGSSAFESEEASARRLVSTLIQDLERGSKVVVRPLAGGHTGLPESVAGRLEGLILGALRSSIQNNMNIGLITGGDVHQIYRSLEESSFSQSSRELLESVLRAAQASTVLVCGPSGSGPESFDILCGVTHGALACPDGGELGSCDKALEVDDVRSLGTAEARFPWRRPSEYLDNVFTELAWKLAKGGRLKEADIVKIWQEGGDTAEQTNLGKLGRYVTRELRNEMARAKQQSLAWRAVEGEGRRFRLVWSVEAWGDDRYELYADLREDLPGGLVHRTGESTHIMISSLPRNMRLAVGGTDPAEEPAEEPEPAPGPVASSSCGPDEETRKIRLPDQPGLTLGDWVYQADKRLKEGDYEALLAEAKRHVRNHCPWTLLLKVKEDAVSGLAAVLREEIETDPGAGLKSLERLEAAAGESYAVLKRLKARAHERLGDASAEAEAYVEWLGLVSQEHPERPEVVSALMRLRSHAKRVAAEGSLGLTPRERAWIRWGLGAPAGTAVGREGAFDDATRSRIRAWQEARGAEPTGYLTTREEARVLVDAGREAEEAHVREAARREEAARRAREESQLVARAEAALGREDCEQAGRDVSALADLNARHPRLDGLGSEVARCGAVVEHEPEMVDIRGGCFQMGSPGSEEGRFDDERRHRVCVEDFRIGKHEVTFEQWDACVSDGGCGGYRPDDEGWGRGERPVINVSWEDANAYARWLSEETGLSYRLPTEAEWEYAARAGTTTPFHFGRTISTEQANYDGNYTYGSGRKGEYRERTMRVGSFRANGFGLHDVHGNVWEWTCSKYDAGYGGAETLCASGSDGPRVLRGGSWDYAPWWVRSANRYWYDADSRLYFLGFRLAQD